MIKITCTGCNKHWESKSTVKSPTLLIVERKITCDCPSNTPLVVDIIEAKDNGYVSNSGLYPIG